MFKSLKGSFTHIHLDYVKIIFLSQIKIKTNNNKKKKSLILLNLQLNYLLSPGLVLRII